MIFGGFNEIPTEDFRRILETNVFGVIYGARAAIQQFRRQEKGILVNMGSLAGIVGQPYSIPFHSLQRQQRYCKGLRNIFRAGTGKRKAYPCVYSSSLHCGYTCFPESANYSG